MVGRSGNRAGCWVSSARSGLPGGKRPEKPGRRCLWPEGPGTVQGVGFLAPPPSMYQSRTTAGGELRVGLVLLTSVEREASKETQAVSLAGRLAGFPGWPAGRHRKVSRLCWASRKGVSVGWRRRKRVPRQSQRRGERPLACFRWWSRCPRSRAGGRSTAGRVG